VVLTWVSFPPLYASFSESSQKLEIKARLVLLLEFPHTHTMSVVCQHDYERYCDRCQTVGFLSYELCETATTKWLADHPQSVKWLQHTTDRKKCKKCGVVTKFMYPQ
jgi:hypothetical protein